MPDSSQKTLRYRSHPPSHESQFHRNLRKGYFNLSLYISGAILLFIFAILSKASLIAPALGVLSIILLVVSKKWKSEHGVLLSTIILFMMVLVNLFHWVDNYFIAIISIDFTSNTIAFLRVLSEAVILTIMAWIYYRLLASFHLHMNEEWFSKKSYVHLYKFLFYFQVYLVFFWVMAFVAEDSKSTTHLSSIKSAIVANAVALLASVIFAIVIITRFTSQENRRHSHRRHHHHKKSEPVKNSDIE